MSRAANRGWGHRTTESRGGSEEEKAIGVGSPDHVTVVLRPSRGGREEGGRGGGEDAEDHRRRELRAT